MTRSCGPIQSSGPNGLATPGPSRARVDARAASGHPRHSQAAPAVRLLPSRRAHPALAAASCSTSGGATSTWTSAKSASHWQQSRCPGAQHRPSANGRTYSSWRGSCERNALSLAAVASRWLLLLLSTAWSCSHLRGLHGAVTAPCPAQAPPFSSELTDAEPDGRRVLSRAGAADHAVTPQAPWTGSGWREHSYGGFGEDTHTSA